MATMSRKHFALSAQDHCFFYAIYCNCHSNAVEFNDINAAEAAQQAIRNGANVNVVSDDTTPLVKACVHENDEIVGTLLDAGADARWRNSNGWSAITDACCHGHLSTVQLLIHHDSGLLETVDDEVWTPLSAAIDRQHSDIVRFLLDSGADPHHADQDGVTALMIACQRGSLDIVRLLLAAGADVEARDKEQQTALHFAADRGETEVVRELILQHNANIFAVDDVGGTPLTGAIHKQHSDLVRFLLDQGADPHHADRWGDTALMTACNRGSLEIVRLLLAAGVDVEARDLYQLTALHHAALGDSSEIMLELIRQHSANMFDVDNNGRTPFDLACGSRISGADIDRLLELYGNKLTQDHGGIALHELLKVAIYSFAEERRFRPPLNPLRIILPLGKLTWKHFRTLLHTLDPELVRNQDDTGKLPIHIACQTNAPAEVLTLILELDPTTLHIADSTGALPIHLLCGNATAATEYASVRYLIQSYPGAVAAQTNAGHYPFMMAAAAEPSTASLSVIYELVRANPGLVVPR